jgi:hypothetical protein
MACWTLIKVAGATISGRFKTLETVPMETRALRATWRTLTVMAQFFVLMGDKSRKAYLTLVLEGKSLKKS